MKKINTYIIEKLKVSANLKIDTRDYETVDMLSTNASDKRKFMEYLQDCIKRDKYAIQASDVDFFNSKVLFYYDKYMRSLCNYSVNDTYIELYDRIIDALRENLFITEKLKVSSNNLKEYNKEYKDKTNRVTYYNAHNYHSEILEVENIDLFMDYWYHFLEGEDEALKENLNINWNDIYVDHDAHDVYVLDSNTGDEITISYDENPRTFYNAYNRIIEYFEDQIVSKRMNYEKDN